MIVGLHGFAAPITIVRGMATMLTLAVVVGCSSPPVAESTSDGVFTLRIEDRDSSAGGRFMIYDLTGDGTLRVGAGAVAQAGETDASVPVTVEEVEAIRSAIQAAGWTTGEVHRSGAGPRRLEVRLRVEGRSHRLEVRANGRDFDPAVIAVLTPLDSISRRRFGDVLDGLPRAR